jgi:hypothetical protein
MPRDLLDSWHDKPLHDLTAQLSTDVLLGLTPQEAAARLQHWGPNALRTG